MSMNYIKPRVSYPNAEKYKSIIYKENRGKSGFYCWTNLITGKFYIGSSENLFLRFKKYYSAYNIKTELKRSKSIIFSSLLKNGYANFKLEILEYITFPNNINKKEKKKIILEREDYYLCLLNPEYNILKKAGSRLGAKHCPESIKLIKQKVGSHLGHKHSDETRNLLKITSTSRKPTKEAKSKMSELARLRIGEKTSFYGKKHKPESILRIKVNNYKKIQIEDIKLSISILFIGNKQAAEYLDIGTSTLRRYKKGKKILKGRYFISNY